MVVAQASFSYSPTSRGCCFLVKDTEDSATVIQFDVWDVAWQGLVSQREVHSVRVQDLQHLFSQDDLFMLHEFIKVPKRTHVITLRTAVSTLKYLKETN